MVPFTRLLHRDGEGCASNFTDKEIDRLEIIFATANYAVMRCNRRTEH